MIGHYLNVPPLANGSRFIPISSTEILYVVGNCLEIRSIDSNSSEIVAKSDLGVTAISYNHNNDLIAYATRSIPPTVFLKRRSTEALVEIIQSDSLLEIQHLSFSQTGRKLAAFAKERGGFVLFIWELHMTTHFDIKSYDLILQTTCRYPSCQVVFDTFSLENKVFVWYKRQVFVGDTSQLQETVLKSFIKLTGHEQITCIQLSGRGSYLLLGLSNGCIAKVNIENCRMEILFRDSSAKKATVQNIFIQDTGSFVAIFSDGRILILGESNDDECHVIKQLCSSHEIIEASLAPDLITVHILSSNGSIFQTPLNLIEGNISKSANITTWKNPDFIVDFCYVVLTGSPSSVLVTASREGTVKVWSLSKDDLSNKIVNLLGCLDLAKRITVMEVLQGYPVCCLGFNDGSITFVHFKRVRGSNHIQLATFHTLSLSDKPIKLISFHRKRRKIILVSSAKSDSIFVLDMDSFNVVGVIENSVSTSFLSWSPDQNHFIIGSVDGNISCYGYDVKSIEQVWECSLESNYLNVGLFFTSTENDSNILTLWRIDQSSKLLHQRVAISNNSLVIQSEPQEFENVRGCSFLFDSTTNGSVIIGGSSNGSVSCFKLNSDGVVDLTMKQNVHSSTIVALKLSPDCSRIGSLGSDGLLCVLNTSDQIVPESIESASYALDHLVVRCSQLDDKHASLRQEVTSVSNEHEYKCLRSPSSDESFDDQILRVLDKVYVGFDCNGSYNFEDDTKKCICNEINKLCCSWTTSKRVMIENQLKSYDSRNQCCSQIVDVCEKYICNNANTVLTEDLLCVSSNEIFDKYHAMTKMHKEKCKVLKFRNEIEHELKRARWSIELLKLEEMNLKEIMIDIKVLSKRSQKLSNEKSLEVKISRHKQALENIQNEQRKLLKTIEFKEKDNHDLMKQIDELGHSIVFLEKEKMNVEERKKHPDLFMKHLMTKHKLKSSVKAQEMEIKKLMNHLQKLREQSFPCFFPYE